MGRYVCSVYVLEVGAGMVINANDLSGEMFHLCIDPLSYRLAQYRGWVLKQMRLSKGFVRGGGRISFWFQ